MREATVSARMNAEMKRRAEEIFEKLGLSHSSAINLFYSQIILKKGLPFQMNLEDEKNNKISDMVAEPVTAYNQKEEVFEDIDKFPQDLMKMLAKFGKSKRAKAKIVKLAVEYFLDELEFLEDCEKRLNDEDEETISEEEFRKEFDL